MSRLNYANIFDAIADTPEEAASLQFRADLMLVFRDYFNGGSEADIGERLGIPHSRVRELMSGKVDTFSSDKLIGFLARAGIQLELAPE
jgi:predicted XRE-type DNA-binding protein